MKKNITTAAFAAIFLTTVAVAQPSAPRPGDRMPPPPQARVQGLQQINTYTGQAGDLVANNDYVYDGFYLQTEAGKMLVKFAPHLGSQLTSIVKNGNSISVKGMERTNPDGIKEIRFVSLAAGGKTITDTGHVTPAPGSQPVEATVSASGKINELQKGRNGEVNGLVLDNKTILRMPPPAITQLGNAATTGNTVSYTGTKKAQHTGEVSSGNYTIIHVQTITINGKEYSVR